MNRFFEPLRVLSEHGVEFVVIGGLGGVLQGAPWVTWDVDICYARNEQNLERLAQALRAMEAQLRGVDEEVPFVLDAETLRRGDAFTFDTRYGPVDILGTPGGFSDYDELSANAVEVDLDGLRVQAASIEDLIRMKSTSDRPKDRAMLEQLGALREETEGS